MDKRGNISSRNMRLFAAIMTLIEALVLTSFTGCADKKVDYGTDTEKLTKSAVCNVKDFSKADDSAIARNEDVLEISKRLLEQNKEAYEVLAK